MANDKLKEFVEQGTKDAAHPLREEFLNHPLCEMKRRQFTAAERLILFTMDRGFIKGNITPPKSLDEYEVESNWPPLGDFEFDPFQNGLPQDDCRNPAWPLPLVGGRGESASSPSDPPDSTMSAAFAEPFAQAAGAGQAWGDPEPHIVNIKPEDGQVGATLLVVGEGILPDAKVYLVDSAGTETALVPFSANPQLDDYYCASFRRTYIRGKIPNVPTDQIYTVRVRNEPKGGPVLNDEHFVGYGPAFKVL